MNLQNLIPNSERTPEYRRELARKMGIASGEARRAKRDAIKAAQMVLSLTPEMPDVIKQQIKQLGIKTSQKDKPTAMIISMSALMRKAMAGDIKSLEFLLNLAGEGGEAEEAAASTAMTPGAIRERLDAMDDDTLMKYEQICGMFSEGKEEEPTDE